MRFAAVGGIATLFQYLLLIALTQLAGADPVHASAIGFCSSALLNYYLNHRLTFRSRKPHWQALPRFSLVALSGLTLNSLLMAVFIRYFGIQYLIAQLVTTSLVLIWNFYLNRRWSFGVQDVSS